MTRTRSPHASARLRRFGIRLMAVTSGVLFVLQVSASAASPVGISASGANGSGTTDKPGVACADGGSGASWMYGYDASLDPGEFSGLPGQLHLDLEIHSEAPDYDSAWMPPGESSVLLQNTRGTLGLDLAAGSGACGSEDLAFDGTTASGSGTWAVPGMGGTGSYRQATGSGTHSFMASVGPGAGNPFLINLSGSLSVLQPSLSVEVVSASWEPGNIDKDFKFATVTFRATNTGPGDSFGARFLSATSSGGGSTPAGPAPQTLGDIAEGDSALFVQRYRFERKQPCQPKESGGCSFDSSLSIELPDALDIPATYTDDVHVRVPTSPGGH
ncbi:MAG: hypothetical protein ACRDH9_04850 [Actinomycetota bacterium]